MIRRAAENYREPTYDGSVHPTQLSDVSTDDITRAGDGGINERSRESRMDLHDTSDELNHTVGDTAEGPDGENLVFFVSLGYESRCRVTTYSIGIPVTVMNLAVCCVEPDLAACDRRKFRVSATSDEMTVPLAASTINKIAVMREKKRIAEARTDRVGQRLIKGAMRIAPTH